MRTFEDLAAFGNLVKGLVDSLEEDKDLGGITGRTPSGKAADIAEENRTIRKQVCDWPMSFASIQDLAVPSI